MNKLLIRYVFWQNLVFLLLIGLNIITDVSYLISEILH